MRNTDRILAKRVYANERYKPIKEENEMFMFIRHMFADPTIKTKRYDVVAEYEPTDTTEIADHPEDAGLTIKPKPTRRTRMSLRERYDRHNEYLRNRRYVAAESVMHSVAILCTTQEERHQNKLASNRASAKRKRIAQYYDGDPTDDIRRLFK